MHVLILAGGSGTRFWPLSLRQRPKQLLALEGDRSLLQATVDRLAPLVAPRDVWICTTEALLPEVRRQLPEVPAEQVLAEPTGRNTAPAIGWALNAMPDEVRGGVVAVLPADHRFGDPEAFRSSLAEAARAADDHDHVVALGVQPRWAETGYGYLEVGDTLGPGLRCVARFTEKPDAAAAERYLAGGRHLWNAGIFVFRGATLLAHLRRLAPEVAAGLERIAATPERLAELYAELPSISIDYAVMEHLETLATVALESGWSDLGSWQALAEVLPAGEAGNRSRGDVVAIDAEENLLIADEGTIAVLGVSGLVVVRTGDSVLVIPKERSQEVRRIVNELRAQDRSELL